MLPRRRCTPSQSVADRLPARHCNAHNLFFRPGSRLHGSLSRLQKLVLVKEEQGSSAAEAGGTASRSSGKLFKERKDWTRRGERCFESRSLRIATSTLLTLIPFTLVDLIMSTEAPVASTSALVGGKAVPQQPVYCAGEQLLVPKFPFITLSRENGWPAHAPLVD